MSTPWPDLLRAALDGELAPEKRAELDAALKDAARRIEFERLRRAQALLGRLPREAPPAGLAREVVRDIAISQHLQAAPVPPAPSVAARVAARVAQDAGESALGGLLRALPQAGLPHSVAGLVGARISREARHNPAPALLAAGLVVAFAVLTASFAWPNLATGSAVLRGLLSQLSPTVFVGFALLLVSCALVTWRPSAQVQRSASLAFALALGLMVPSLWSLFDGNAGGDLVRLGGDVIVDRPVSGNVVALGGNVELRPGARVGGQVIAFLGDVDAEKGARVAGRQSALLGEVHGPGTARFQTTQPLPALGTASAFQPLLAWLGGAAWARVYVAALGALTLLLFVGGAAPLLARRQRRAPLQTLALGILVFGLLAPPLALGALSGFLVPAFVGAVLALLALSVGLTVSLYDAGRAISRTLRLPLPDTLGALIGLSAFAAALSVPPLAFVLWLLGGCWGAGALLLARPEFRNRNQR